MLRRIPVAEDACLFVLVFWLWAAIEYIQGSEHPPDCF
jgi:hypothetical protein